MEWVEGVSLAQRLRRGPLSVGDAVTLGARVADALGAAHQRGVVHRDVKPGNVVLADGSLADAKLLEGDYLAVDQSALTAPVNTL